MFKKTLTHYSPLIQPSFIWSKWNMCEILMMKSGLEIIVVDVGMINETLSQKFYPYSILNGSGKVEFLIYCVLTAP